MKKQVLMLLSLFCVCFSGCSWFSPTIERAEPVEITYKYVECFLPEPPVYTKLSGDEHIGSKQNLDILIKNMILRRNYIKSLLECVNCYTAQIKKDE